MMNNVKVKDTDLRKAAEEGMDEFVKVFTDAMMQYVGGQLDAEGMQKLNADQITLLAYIQMRDEVMDGGFVQLIYNGYGGFIFLNPFAKALRTWGMDDLARVVQKAGQLYRKHRGEIERELTDEEFMALFEQYPAFDELDDTFVEHEEQWTGMVACYVDEHIDRFAEIEE